MQTRREGSQPMSLREPFFLRGKQGWLDRAIWMSLALGGMGFVVGTAWFAGALLLADTVLADLVSEDTLIAIVAGLGGLMLSVPAILFSHWCGWSWLGFACRAVWLTTVPMAPWLIAVLSQQTINELCGGLLEWLGSVFALDVETIVLLFTPLWVAWSTACVRPLQPSLPLVGASLLSVPLVLVLFPIAERLPDLYRTWLPWAASFDLMDMAAYASVGGQFFAALLVPWGIPFWRPPVVAKTPDDVRDLPAQAIAITARDPLEA